MNQQQPTSEVPDTASDTISSALNEDQQEVSRILRGLHHDPTFLGCFSLGKDGIMRSLTADRDVVDAVAFSPKLIKAFLDRMPFDPKAEEDFRGVDGTHVPREQWFHPDKSMLPRPMTQETKERSMRELEEKKEIIQEWRENMAKREELKGCPVVVRSNYNLDPKPADDE